ncbi:hypothetical protein DXG01_012121 [Tephrocybe rancida]|nr:hypothetical protein DXG01_012121 [Tephrocybe rancida]
MTLAIGLTPLSFVPVPLSKLPPEDDLIRDGLALLEASKKWKKLGGSFAETELFSYRADQTWLCRVTKVRAEDITFGELWRKLGVDKPENEKRPSKP